MLIETKYLDPRIKFNSNWNWDPRLNKFDKPPLYARQYPSNFKYQNMPNIGIEIRDGRGNVIRNNVNQDNNFQQNNVIPNNVNQDDNFQQNNVIQNNVDQDNNFQQNNFQRGDSDAQYKIPENNVDQLKENSQEDAWTDNKENNRTVHFSPIKHSIVDDDDGTNMGDKSSLEKVEEAGEDYTEDNEREQIPGEDYMNGNEREQFLLSLKHKLRSHLQDDNKKAQTTSPPLMPKVGTNDI